jgi:hypothetical protein
MIFESPWGHTQQERPWFETEHFALMQIVFTKSTVMIMSKEAEMTTSKKQETGQSPKKYLWFGSGNYGGRPTQQIGGGIVRDPNLIEELRDPSPGRSPIIYVGGGVIGFTVLVILFVWGISLFIH